MRFEFDFFCVAVCIKAMLESRTGRPGAREIWLTLFLAFLVSFFFGLALVDCCGVGGAALVVCGDAVWFLWLGFAAAGADGGGIDRCCGVVCTGCACGP